MLTELFTADRATTTVSSGGGSAPASGTVESWTVASSAMFGAAQAGISQFHVADPAAPSELIAVTSVSGNSWTVVRGAESTVPVTHAAGFTVDQVISGGWLAAVASGTQTTVPVGQGGTGQVTAAAAYNALSPMTTTGDLEYEAGTNTAGRLAGNTSATMAVLTQTGTGSASAAPAWSLVNAASSVPGLDSAQRYVTPVGSFLMPSPPPVSRRPAWRAASFSQIFQAGHGFTATGSGIGSSNANDTSTFIKGTQCFTVTTAANGAQANIRKTGMSAFDMTGKCLRLTFKVDNVTHLVRLLFYVGTSSFANYLNWTVHTHSGSAQNYVQSGEWVTITIPWANVQTASGSFSISSAGVPSTTTGFTDMEFAVVDDGAGAVTVHLQAIEIIPDTPATFPGGVVSVVFDDSYQSVYDNARPVMDSYGYRGTLYTIASSIGVFGSLTLAELKNLQVISGWEIGGHAWTLAAHNAGYDTLTALQVEDEMRYLRAWMLSNGFGLDSFAYPQGHFSVTSDNVPIDQICGQYFSTGRSIISETHETFAPAMPYRLRSKSGISSAGTAISVITGAGGDLDRCQLDGSWYIVDLHDVTTGAVTVNTQISASDFATFMAAINSRGIPVLPVADVIRNYA